MGNRLQLRNLYLLKARGSFHGMAAASSWHGGCFLAGNSNNEIQRINLNKR
jgi:hypothetical protein